MQDLEIKIPDKLVPVFEGEAMYRGAYGGRGSAKSRTFAKMAAVRGAMMAEAGMDGTIVCGREYQNSLDESSMAEVKAAIREEPWLLQQYDVGEKYIRTRNRLITFDFSGLRFNTESLKSKSKIRIMWIDEAEQVTEAAYGKIDPTIREEGSELWATWNPARKKSATHKRFRDKPPPFSKIIQMNWRDNPWFPKTLEIKRAACLENQPDQYDHIWEGGFVKAVEGSYFGSYLTKARAERRIVRVAFDPLIRPKIFCDLGGTGARADAFTMWPAQFIDKEIRVRDYYEAQGQSMGHHVAWLQEHGYKPGTCDIYLPHDGKTQDRVLPNSFEGAFKAAGYDVVVVPNQGKGAAKMRVESARRHFGIICFDEATTEDGREALGWYHEKKSDDEREMLLGPEHDWSSHCCDAFGLMCAVYEDPAFTPQKSFNRDIVYPEGSYA